MLYNVTNDFVKIDETSGTIQNNSRIFDIEISHKTEADSGILLRTLNKYTFTDQTIYVRCIDKGGRAEVRVVPFIVDSGGVISGGGSSITYDHFTDEDIDDVLPHF